MDYDKIIRKKILCANCGKIGHEYRICSEPITSFGIINIRICDDTNESLVLKERFSTNRNVYYRIASKKHPEIKCYMTDNIRLNKNDQEIYKLDNEIIPCEMDEHLNRFCYYKDKIMFMMVSRRFSLGFIEFIRGKYDISDPTSIINLFEQMTSDEIKFIRKSNYDDILYYFLNRHSEPKETVLNRIYEGRYSNEYCDAKIKFNIMSNPTDEENNVPWDLNFYTKNIKPKWKKPEWGFPKGRRDKKTEENLACACREFEEETGYNNDDYAIMNKIEPIEERLVGTNGVKYKHIYYMALNNSDTKLPTSNYDTFEIGDIKWFTYDEAMSHIRPYHKEKKAILTKVYLFILNYLIHNNYDL